MANNRNAGVLVHLTSLPGKHGIGDLGEGAYRFIDFLVASGQRLWQVLPTGPTDPCNSPYASYSAFGGNPLLINIDYLKQINLLDAKELSSLVIPEYPNVNYPFVNEVKHNLLQIAFQRYRSTEPTELTQKLLEFQHRQQHWLSDYSLFMALKDHFQGVSWTKWPEPIRRRQPEAITAWQKSLAAEIQYQEFLQYLFFTQWDMLKTYANDQGIKMIGDLPIFVAHDSADVWTYSELFDLDNQGIPTAVAGVPPDYFSATGQHWGNPLYNWSKHKEQDYSWWISRIETLLSIVDLIRVDHFRGFEAYWSIPFGEKTAVNGNWKKGPGACFFQAIEQKIGYLPIICEDLGFITKEVEELRDQFKLPGMRVLQFAFDELRANVHTPHNHVQNSVVYTGTHDNDTTLGWFQKATKETQTYALRYLGTNSGNIAWDFIRAAYASPANTAIIPLQDILSLDTKSRMNTPGTAEHNWEWRFHPSHLTDEVTQRLAAMTTLYER